MDELDFAGKVAGFAQKKLDEIIISKKMFNKIQHKHCSRVGNFSL